MDFFKLNKIMNEQQEPHIVERRGLTADERYFIGWKKELPSHMANDVFADGQYGSYRDAVKFPSKEAAEEAVARIEDKDGYGVYASPLEEPAPQATQHKIEAWTDPNERPKRGRLVTKDGIDITDKLPFKTVNFRGDPIVVVDFEAPHKPSSTGRINTNHGSFFPSVADLEIVDHDFSEQRAN